jgi:enolase-phosphatase E1
MQIDSGSHIVLDIEGTVAPIAFVHDVLFPYARRALEEFLLHHSSSVPVQECMEQVARDAGASCFSEWCPHPKNSHDAVAWVVPILHEWMDANAKKTGLKSLQGLIWAHGYHDGTLTAPLFPDVQPALTEWIRQGIAISIYSSGSIGAQKLFFSHTTQGDLTPLLTGYFDTTSGHKQEVQSYRRIHLSFPNAGGGTPLFFSDVPAELDAAREAGWATALVIRPGNAPVSHPTHPVIHSFAECVLA